MRQIQPTCGSICRLTTTVSMLQWSHKKELQQPVVAAVSLLSSCIHPRLVESLKSQTSLLRSSHHWKNITVNHQLITLVFCVCAMLIHGMTVSLISEKRTIVILYHEYCLSYFRDTIAQPYVSYFLNRSPDPNFAPAHFDPTKLEGC